MSRANRIYTELERMYPEVKSELDYRTHFELLIAVVLSAQTTDVAVNKVTPRLFKNFPDAEALGKAEFSEVHEIIKTIGLSNTKARNIIALSKRLVQEKNGEVPADFDYLISLPGVGRKTANVVLGEAFRIPAIPVDTHVLRVSNRLTLSDSKNPLVVEKDLSALYPKEKWYYLHLRLIHFGRYFCKAQRPKCEECSFTDFCRYFNS
ncbi:MAG TPA: endonuclease III [Acholeplasmataceae bacterium]|jgi:endonuclease-3|nr:endonuclease III [Acholeplasmataceae bacterium]